MEFTLIDIKELTDENGIVWRTEYWGIGGDIYIEKCYPL